MNASDKVQVDYHAVVVAVDHDGAAASQVNVFFPPVAYLKFKDDIAFKYRSKRTAHTDTYFEVWLRGMCVFQAMRRDYQQTITEDT